MYSGQFPPTSFRQLIQDTFNYSVDLPVSYCRLYRKRMTSNVVFPTLLNEYVEIPGVNNLSIVPTPGRTD